ERDGYNHLYLYNEQGIMEQQLTNGSWVVTELIGADKKGREVYFMATKQSPLNRNLYKVDVRSGQITELTSESAYHFCEGTTDKAYWIDQYSAYNIPGVTRILEEKSKTSRVVLTSKNPLKEFELGSLSTFTIRSSDDSVDLWCRMIKP